jgi:hypothetical protein
MEITLDRAKAIVSKGIEHGAWDWDDSSDVTDDKVMKAADRLIDVATQASTKGSVNDAVLEILHVAQVVPASEQTREAYVARFGTDALAGAPAASAASSVGAFAQPTPADVSAMARASSPPVEPQSSAPSEPAHSPASAAGGIDINSIYPGYDDQKVAEIKKAVLHFASIGDLTPEEWEQIKVYEAAHEERKTILSLQPEFKAPEPEPTPVIPSAAQAGVSAFGGGGAPPQSSVEFFANGAREGNDGDSVAAFYNGESISRAQQEQLPIPPQTTGEGVVMPIDITNTSDQELSRLATAYHSLFARTQWLISQEEGRERAAEQLEHDTHRDAYVKAYENHKGAIPEGKSGPTALDAARKLAEKDADGAQEVSTWRTRKVRHGIDARELKALSAGYDKAVFRINDELERRTRLATSGHVVK